MTELTARELLIMLYETALDAVDGRVLVNQWCRHDRSQHSDAGNQAFSHAIAIGKAAPAMLQGALDAIPTLQRSLLIGLPAAIPRSLHRNSSVDVIISSHPVPDEQTLAAGEVLLQFVATLSAQDRPLFLISGGTSSMVEVPVAGITLEQLQQINRYLLASGMDIHQINAWRQRFSRIKGGGLLNYLKTRSNTQLLISDVRGDDPAVIGSGLLVQAKEQPGTPSSADAFLSSFLGVENTLEDEPAHGRAVSQARVDSVVIANLRMAMQAVHVAAQSQGLASFVYDDFIAGEATIAAYRLYRRLADAEPGIHIFGGETTVSLPDTPGIGGRNQTFALAFARCLEEHTDLHLLAAGTDGIDGNSSCAGAVVSHYTKQKAAKLGFDIDAEIEKANAGLLLMATDDLVDGSNSHTNVMDIIIAYKTAY